MSGFINDLRFGLRQLVKRPGFAAAAILTLALGIGANTAVFSILNGYLLKPLPYPHGAELAQVDTLSKMFPGFPVSRPIYRVIQEHTDAFAATGLYREEPFDLHMGGHAKRVRGLVASASLFRVPVPLHSDFDTFSEAARARGKARRAGNGRHPCQAVQRCPWARAASPTNE